MQLRLTAVALAAVIACSAVDAAGTTCPALEPKDSDPLSAILQHVCKRGEGGIDCGEIPDLLKQLSEANLNPTFDLAGKAANLMCDPCLDSIRQGLIYLSDPPVTKGAPHPTITDTAAKSACSPKCLPKYKVIADQFTKAAPEALKQYKALEAACLKDALPAIGAAVTGEMKALFATLESVRDLASGGMYMRAEASSADAPRSFATSKVLRVAAFGCLALGTVLLAVAAFVARRPESELRVESELL